MLDPAVPVVVASSTRAVPIDAFVLGVPAETPLELIAVARTARPGPERLAGGMPAYLGRAVRTIPLQSEQERVELFMQRAGVLTWIGVGSEGPVGLRWVREGASLRSPVPARAGGLRSDVLPEGRYDVEILLDGAVATRVLSGLWIARETESLAVLPLAPPASPRPGAPHALDLELVGPDGSPLSEPGVLRLDGGAQEFGLVVRALDAAEKPIAVRADLTVAIRVESSTQTAGADALPAILRGLRAERPGRLAIRAEAVFEDGRTLFSRLDANALAAGERSATAFDLALEIEDPSALAAGTELTVLLLDPAGRLAAEDRGTIDLSLSDPWIVIDGGAEIPLAAADRGVAKRRIARPSAPRGLPVVLRARFGTITSSLALPLLSLPRRSR